MRSVNFCGVTALNSIIVALFAPCRTMYIQLGSNSLGAPRNIPVIVARGRHAGPVLGITACIHGNELNGIPLIHRYAVNGLQFLFLSLHGE